MMPLQSGSSAPRITPQIVVGLGIVVMGLLMTAGNLGWIEAYDLWRYWPLIVISSEQLRTLPVGLALFVVHNRTVWDLLMAGSVVATIPVLIVFLIFQRHFVKGIAMSGMKG